MAYKVKLIYPDLPEDPGHLRELDNNLKRMDCAGFREVAWKICSEAMVRELKDGAPRQYNNTIRAQAKQWTPELWSKTYGFGQAVNGICTRKENFAADKFSKTPDPKEGYAIADYMNAGARRVLEFLCPILYSEKPGSCTTKMAGTILGSYFTERTLAWGQVVHVIVERMWLGIEKTK